MTDSSISHVIRRRGMCVAFVLAMSFGFVVAPFCAMAQSADKSAERAARRAQLQMQNLQQQVTDAQAAKAKAETDKAAVDKQLAEQAEQVTKLKSALPRVSNSLKSSEEARATLAATVASLEKQLAEQKRSSEELLASKERERLQLTRQRDEQLGQSKAQLAEQTGMVAECSAKNDRLVRLGADLLDRYRNKGYTDVAKQREPMLGLGDVQTFNLIQQYRDKVDAERYLPTPSQLKPSP